MLDNNIVISRLIGGLGNQLFQYATGRALALKLGAQLKLDTSSFDHYTLRKYELAEMKIAAMPATQTDLSAFSIKQVSPFSFAPLIAKTKRRLGFRSASIYTERGFAYDAGINGLAAPVYIDGYWQSEKYFLSIASDLRKELQISSALDEANQAVLNAIRKADSAAISLHVRRGDYVSNASTAQYHGVCSLEYYRAAVEHMSVTVANPHFFIFSDDPDWVAENMKLAFPTTLVKANSADRGVFDLHLMKSCHHHIVANSSFSWWGAWLNPFADKIVVAPAQWFSGASHDTSDLVPKSWVRL